MNNIIDQWLNRITMYRLMLYYAATLLTVAFGLGFFSWCRMILQRWRFPGC